MSGSPGGADARFGPNLLGRVVGAFLGGLGAPVENGNSQMTRKAAGIEKIAGDEYGKGELPFG